MVYVTPCQVYELHAVLASMLVLLLLIVKRSVTVLSHPSTLVVSKVGSDVEAV